MKFVFGILALIVVIALGSLVLREPPTSPLENYDNAAYGISFEYPNSYALQEREVGDGHRYHYSIALIDKEALANVPENGEGPAAITIDIFQNNLDKEAVETWVRGRGDSNFKLSPDQTLASTTVDSAPALSYSWDGLYRGESVVFAHNDNIVMLSVTSFTPDDPIREDFDRLLSSISLH